MRLLQYKDLDLRRVKPAFAKVRAAIEAGDFRSADVKKLHVDGYYPTPSVTPHGHKRVWTSSVGSKASTTASVCIHPSGTRRRPMQNAASWPLNLVYVESRQGHRQPARDPVLSFEAVKTGRPRTCLDYQSSSPFRANRL